MFFAKIQGEERPSVRSELRRATNAPHQRMHELEPFVQIAAGTLQITQYRHLLEALFRFHSIVSEAVRSSPWSPLSSAPQRLELLRSDLAFFGDTVPTLSSDWPIGAGKAVLGTLYAAEGSMVGGRLIARQLDYAFGSSTDGRRFLTGHELDRVYWSRLIEVLEDECRDPEDLNAAISGAHRAFDLFERCIGRHISPVWL
jgi:heme oxygenase